MKSHKNLFSSIFSFHFKISYQNEVKSFCLSSISTMSAKQVWIPATFQGNWKVKFVLDYWLLQQTNHCMGKSPHLVDWDNLFLFKDTILSCVLVCHDNFRRWCMFFPVSFLFLCYLLSYFCFFFLFFSFSLSVFHPFFLSHTFIKFLVFLSISFIFVSLLFPSYFSIIRFTFLFVISFLSPSSLLSRPFFFFFFALAVLLHSFSSIYIYLLFSPPPPSFFPSVMRKWGKGRHGWKVCTCTFLVTRTPWPMLSLLYLYKYEFIVLGVSKTRKKIKNNFKFWSLYIKTKTCLYTASE